VINLDGPDAVIADSAVCRRASDLGFQLRLSASVRFDTAWVTKYGLTDWASERFAISGPPEYCVERLQELVEWGITGFCISHKGPDIDGFSRQWQEPIMPNLR
jgi:hypothetical protein